MTNGKLTVEVQNHTFLTSALLGIEWSTTPQPLYPGKSVSLWSKLEGGPHCLSEWFREETVPCSCMESNPLSRPVD